MSSFLARGLAKFFREVKSPRDAVTFCWRVLLPVDPHVRERHSWIWGKLPRFEINQVLPGVEQTEIRILTAYNDARASTLEIEELASLLAIAKLSGARKIFEIGTYDGSTSWNLAANTPIDAQIVTLDLPPNWNGDLSIDTPREYRNKTKSTVGHRFRNTPDERKITQVFGDSAAIDWSQLPVPFDIVFVDGCHYCDYVRSDTRNALKHTRPGGLVIWHDYGNLKGVSDVVDETSDKIKVTAIAGTRLAIGFVGTSAAE